MQHISGVLSPFEDAVDILDRENCVVNVNRLPKGVDAASLREFFDQFGEIVSFKLKRGYQNAITGRCTIVYSTPVEAARVIASGNMLQYGENFLHVYTCLSNINDRLVNRNIEQDRLILIYNIPDNLTEEDIENLFNKFGQITFLNLNKNAKGANNGSGFVCFSAADEVSNFMNNINLEFPIKFAKLPSNTFFVERSSGSSDQQTRTVFINYKPTEMKENIVRRFMSNFGKLVSLEEHFNQYGYETGSCEVEFSTIDEAANVVAHGNSLVYGNVYGPRVLISEIPQHVDEHEILTFFRTFGKIFSFVFDKDDNGVNIGTATVIYVDQGKVNSFLRDKDQVEYREHTLGVKLYDHQNSNLSQDCIVSFKGVPIDVTENDLNTLFSRYGKVVALKLNKNADNMNNGTGYVCYSSPDEVAYVTQNNTNTLKLNDLANSTLHIKTMKSHDVYTTKMLIENASSLPDNVSTIIDIHFIPKTVVEQKLGSIFSRYGQIKYFQIYSNSYVDDDEYLSGKIAFTTATEATRALVNGNDLQYDDRGSSASFLITNIPHETTKTELWEFFSDFGVIYSVNRVLDNCGVYSGSIVITYEISGENVVHKSKNGKLKFGEYIVGVEHLNPRTSRTTPSNCIVTVSNIPQNTVQEELVEFFSDFGRVTLMKLNMNSQSIHNGTGFVCFSSSDATSKVLSNNRSNRQLRFGDYILNVAKNPVRSIFVEKKAAMYTKAQQCKVHLNFIPLTMNYGQIYGFLKKFGKIHSLELSMDDNDKHHVGRGRISYHNPKDADKLIENGNVLYFKDLFMKKNAGKREDNNNARENDRGQNNTGYNHQDKNEGQTENHENQGNIEHSKIEDNNGRGNGRSNKRELERNRPVNNAWRQSRSFTQM